ncbi:MAG: hypothetical protein D6677_13875 [Calditrichaeota bacterium]|nr:MAG: hypothetical protein D6677_13875 [Calditrichota bacterium]
MEKLSHTSAVSAYGRYNPKNKSGGRHKKPVYYIDNDLSALQDKVARGDILKARIVLDLENGKYVLRFLGYNFIMESKIKFNRFDEVELEVEAVTPRLKLRIRPPQQHSPNALDILA